MTEKMFTSAVDIVQDAVNNTKKRAEIAQNVVDALSGNDALAPWPGETFAVWIRRDAHSLTPTRIEELPGGVEVDFWGETPIAYRFPAGAEVEVADSWSRW